MMLSITFIEGCCRVQTAVINNKDVRIDMVLATKLSQSAKDDTGSIKCR